MSQHISHGADVEQLDDIAVGLRRQGDRIADVGGRGASLLEKLRAVWDGPDFEKFASQWRSAHRVIDDAESAMRTYSRKLVDEAEQQRHSSGVPGDATQGYGDGRPPLRQQAPEHPSLDGSATFIAGSLSVPPRLPGAQPVDRRDPSAARFERFERPAVSAWAPTQTPTGAGAYVTTAPDSLGQPSVAFDPVTAGFIGRFPQDALPADQWLWPQDPDLLPRP